MVVHFNIRSKGAPPSPPRDPSYPSTCGYSSRGPAARAAAVARAAQRCVEAALESAQVAREAAAAAADEVAATVTTEPLSYPPDTNQQGDRYFFARSHPNLDDGIYSVVAIRNRGVDADVSAPSGVLVGFNTESPCFRKSYLSGVDRGAIFWR